MLKIRHTYTDTELKKAQKPDRTVFRQTDRERARERERERERLSSITVKPRSSSNLSAASSRRDFSEIELSDPSRTFLYHCRIHLRNPK